jgi:putative N6-adenine-specific DNA methylase
LQRLPPAEPGPVGGVMILNPPYGERIEPKGSRGERGPARHSREGFHVPAHAPGDGGDGGHPTEFFSQLASHWKRHYAGWTAWLLSPDMKLPQALRLKESRRMPMWNGPIECRLYRFDLVAGSARAPVAAASEAHGPTSGA